MKLLLDTHNLIWASQDTLPLEAAQYILNEENTLLFSSASIWEVAIKNALNRPDFNVNPALLRRGLLENGYEELAITSLHSVLVGDLPLIHKDPFDRMLIAQTRAEGIILITSDTAVAEYGGAIILVGGKK
jgi:PIN domain nuclease of toxin-antitoxin system